VTDTFTPPHRLPAWRELEAHAARLRQTRVTALFEGDPQRFDAFSRTHDGLLLDCSKQLLDRAALASLLARFVANIDPRELDAALAAADPASTFFIVKLTPV